MAKKPDSEHEYEHGTMVETSKPEVLRPPLYQVVLLNDDFTPMDFVVEVLQVFFAMNRKRRPRSCSTSTPAAKAFAASTRGKWLNRKCPR